MRSKYERTLINMAHNMIGVLKVEPHNVGGFDPKRFYREVISNQAFVHFIKGLNPGTMGEIIHCSLGQCSQVSDFRKTSSIDCFDGSLWIGKEGQQLQIDMASVVVIATMYDILATWYFLEVEYFYREQPQGIMYLPLDAMKAWVLKKMFVSRTKKI